MTLIDLSHTDLKRQGRPHTLTVTWSATRRRFDCGKHHLDREFLVLQLELLNHDTATVAAWVESSDAVRIILPRQMSRVSCRHDHGFMHVDAHGDRDDDRLLSFSLRAASNEPHELVFARTALLGKAGFVAGAFDRPTLRPAAAATVSA